MNATDPDATDPGKELVRAEIKRHHYYQIVFVVKDFHLTCSCRHRLQ
jgi:hypothetical protein